MSYLKNKGFHYFIKFNRFLINSHQKKNASARHDKVAESVLAVFVYQDKVYAIRRQPHLNSFPGYHSFPGGKVDSNESQKPFSEPLLKKYDSRYMRALYRELKEELVDLVPRL